METPMPDNSLPMLTGVGQFGPLEMGGIFSVVMVREGLALDDYKDPGWYQYPAGTLAYEFAGRRRMRHTAVARRRDERTPRSRS
jgi:hypothetical protein